MPSLEYKINVMSACHEGKKIQYKWISTKHPTWLLWDHQSPPNFNWTAYDFRIAPNTTYYRVVKYTNSAFLQTFESKTPFLPYVPQPLIHNLVHEFEIEE